MLDIIEYTNGAFGNAIRAMMKDGEPWFVAKDICDAIGLGNPTNAVRPLADDEKGLQSVKTPGGEQMVNVISESGMFTLALRCRDALEEGSPAYQFRRWVTSDVLPALRKTGTYSVPAVIQAVTEDARSVRAQAMLLNAETRRESLILKETIQQNNLAMALMDRAIQMGNKPVGEALLIALANDHCGLTTSIAIPAPTVERESFSPRKIGARYDLTAEDVRQIARDMDAYLDEGKDYRIVANAYADGSGVNPNCREYFESGIETMHDRLVLRRSAKRLRRVS